MRSLRVPMQVFLCLAMFGTADELIGMPDTNRPVQPALQRSVVHTDAYKKRTDIGPHVEIKVTPPEQRGRKGYLLVEVYNYSKTNVSLADFSLNLVNGAGDSIDANIRCQNIRSGLSALKWIKIPGDGTLPKITKVSVVNMRMYSDQTRALKLPYTTDLIKR